MPFIEVSIVEGRTPQQVRELISALTHAVVQTLDAPLPSVRVVVRELPTTHWAAGDVTIAERQSAPGTGGGQTAAAKPHPPHIPGRET